MLRSNMNPRFLIPVLLLIIIASVLFFIKTRVMPQNTTSPKKVTILNKSDQANNIEVIATNLDIPWEIVFLPDGDMLVTERSGKLLKIGKTTQTIQQIEGVKHIGEGGLLGLALHPNFDRSHLIYLYSTTNSGGQITNRVEKYKLENNKLTSREVILENIPGSSNHDGGRIAFGPDGYLYITTGDAENPNLAQDKNSLNGKILRITDTGEIPNDNPFGNAVYSFGHRNPQGITWDNNGNLWATEHGPSGTQTGNDEVNLIVKGNNYGWPTIKGQQTALGLTKPVLESGTKDTWAPSGMVYFNGSLFFTGLKGEALYQARINNTNSLTLSEHFKKEYGRIRTVVLGPDGFLYIATNNTDGRGTPKEGDDKIIKINPAIFE